MDPNATIRAMLEILDVIHASAGESENGVSELHVRFCQNAMDLKSWVDCGGFRPKVTSASYRLLCEPLDWLAGYLDVSSEA